MRVTGRVSGLRELERAFRGLQKRMGRKAQERALLAGGEVIAETARGLVSVRSGELRDSIAVSTGQAHYGPYAREGVVGLAGQGLSSGGVTVYVGPAAPDGWYGHMVEFGTVNAPAHPFMRPAFDMAKGQALNVVAASLRGELH